MRICAPATSLNEQATMGGGVFHVRNLQGLADRGVQCLIPLAFRTDHSPRENWDVVPIPVRRTFRLGALYSNIVFFFVILWLRFVRRESFDLIRVGDMYHFGPGAALAARICRVPSVGMIHHVEPENRRENLIVGWTARRLDGITVPSKATLENVHLYYYVPKHQLHLITEGASSFEGAPKSKEEAKEHFGLGGHEVIGFLGGLIPRKNIPLLIEAFESVAEKRPDARLLIVGGGPLRTNLESIATSLKLTDKIHFTGPLTDVDKATAYKAMDVMAFPSLMEGFGLSVVEAMAQGVPAVVSNLGSLPEVVTDKKTGFVVSVEDHEPMAQAIEKLLEDDSLRKKMGDAAKSDVNARFTWEECAKQTQQAYQQVLDENKKEQLGVLLNTGDSLEQMKKAGQYDRFVSEYLKRYSEKFSRVYVLSYENETETLFDNVHVLPKSKAMPGLFWSFLMPFVYRNVFRKCSLIRVMQTQGALPAVIAKLLYGVPFVVTYGYLYGDSMRLKNRPGYGIYLDWLERIALRLCAKVIATTPSLKKHVSRFATEKKIWFVPNGVDTKAFRPLNEKRSSKEFSLLYVGRLEPHKNLELVIEAIAPINTVKVKLVVAGTGPMKNSWEELCEKLNVDCEFLGSVPHEKLPAIHQKADVFVLPSKFEGHPKVLIEAFASGLACVGAKSPGIVDVIEDGVDGLLAKPTVSGFAEQIVRLVHDKDLRKRLGEAARVKAEKEYDLEKLLDREMDFLMKLGKGEKQ